MQVAVWDRVVRYGHWTLAAGFALAWLTEDWRTAHIVFGSIVAAIVANRIVWGFVGSRYARFGNFVRPFQDVRAHLAALRRGEVEPTLGHNPAGGWAVVAMLGLLVAICASGLLVWLTPHGGLHEAAEEIHEAVANGMLVLVAIHIVAVLVMSVLQRESLVRAMLTGYKKREQ